MERSSGVGPDDGPAQEPSSVGDQVGDGLRGVRHGVVVVPVHQFLVEVVLALWQDPKPAVLAAAEVDGVLALPEATGHSRLVVVEVLEVHPVSGEELAGSRNRDHLVGPARADGADERLLGGLARKRRDFNPHPAGEHRIEARVTHAREHRAVLDRDRHREAFEPGVRARGEDRLDRIRRVLAVRQRRLRLEMRREADLIPVRGIQMRRVRVAVVLADPLCTSSMPLIASALTRTSVPICS